MTWTQLYCRIPQLLILTELKWAFANGKSCYRLATWPLIKAENHINYLSYQVIGYIIMIKYKYIIEYREDFNEVNIDLV